uniref:Rho-GAP domain-containing protein n=1 Tax=Brugia timori TaxID=42155 RepID=A0A0R3QEW2_9BILA
LRLRDIFDVFVCEHIEDDRLRDKLSCPTYVVPEILKDSPEYAARALIFGMLRKESSEHPTVEQLLYIALDEQCLNKTNVVSFRSTLLGWLEIPSFRGVISNSAFEFAGRIMKVIFNFSTKNEDQVVPAFSPAMCNVQQHLRIMHNIIADSFLATASKEENVAELPSPSHFAPVLAVITTF